EHHEQPAPSPGSGRRPGGTPLPHPGRVARLPPQLQLRAPPRPWQHRPRPPARQQRRPGPRRDGVRHPSAPGHGDRHLGAGGDPRAQGLRGEPGPPLPGPGAADERRHRHLALGDEQQRGGGRALRADVGAPRHGVGRSRLRAARHQRGARPGRPRAHRLRQGPRRSHLAPPGERRAVGRPTAAGPAGGRARRRPRPPVRRPWLRRVRRWPHRPRGGRRRAPHRRRRAPPRRRACGRRGPHLGDGL
ncbi:MAG: Pirin, partial [uncultured Acidimicrobiales bacterium]